MVHAEIGFLRHHSTGDDEGGLRTPKLFFGDYNPRTADFVLMLEDLRPVGRPVSMTPGAHATTRTCTVPLAKQALSAQAALHAAYWGEAGCKDAAMFARRPNSPENAFVPMVIGDAWPKTMAWLEEQPGLLDAAAMAVVRAVGAEAIADPELWAAEASTTAPVSLTHGDAHCENYLFSQSEEQAVAIDFQLVEIGQPAWVRLAVRIWVVAWVALNEIITGALHESDPLVARCGQFLCHESARRRAGRPRVRATGALP